MGNRERLDALTAQLGQLVDGIDRGDFNSVSEIPDTYTYGHLLALFMNRHMLDGGAELFEQFYDLATACALHHVKQRALSGKVRVVFLTYSAAEWQAEGLYRLLEKDERFETLIVTCPLIDRPRDAADKTFEETSRFFESGNYHVKRGFYGQRDHVCSWEELGGLPDIAIHLFPYSFAVPQSLSIEALPFRCLNIYIPYGMDTVDSPERKYLIHNLYNFGFMNLVWRVYAESRETVTGFCEHQVLKGKNVVYSGYPKMDFFFDKSKQYGKDDLRRIWKIPDGKTAGEMKKVIIAPHHSISPNHLILFSTFRHNAFFWPYLAQKYADRVSFIYKPHPNVRATAVEQRVFPDYEAYDAYTAEWDALPNARVVTEDSYLEIFATSDAMIMDSGSFIAEYLYADKPLCFLTRKEQAFSALGEAAMQAHYRVPGTDYHAVERFLEEVVLGQNDTMARERKRIFSEHLDYVAENGCLASDFIYNDIVGSIEERRG